MQALSRYREFAADRGAAVITGRPSALASALLKISGIDGAHPDAGPARAARAERVLHLPARRGKSLVSLFSTHPPMEKRIARLPRLEAQLQGGARAASPRSRMGFLDALLGRRKTQGPAPDRLFAITTAYVDARDRARHHARAARRRSSSSRWPPATSSRSSRDIEELVRGTGEETGTRRDPRRRVRLPLDVLARPRRRGPRRRRSTRSATRSQSAATATACSRAVFAFEDATGQPLYLIYNYKRGTWYPFVPAPGEQAARHRARAADQGDLGAELPIEPELERWFPLWGIPI